MRMTSEELRKRNDKLIQEAEEIGQIIRQLKSELNLLMKKNSNANKSKIERIRQKIKDLEVERFHKHTGLWMMD